MKCHRDDHGYQCSEELVNEPEIEGAERLREFDEKCSRSLFGVGIEARIVA
jgi:hypothetical protein